MVDFSDYKNLDVWTRSMNLVESAYSIAKQLPQEERFGLSDQIRRSSISIPSNIAEGYRRYSKPDFIRFLSISLGSISELETQLILCNSLYSIDINKELNEIEEITKMLIGLIKTKKKNER